MQLYLIIPERVQDPGVYLILFVITLVFYSMLSLLKHFLNRNKS